MLPLKKLESHKNVNAQYKGRGMEISKGIYWVYFSAGHNELKLSVHAEGRAAAKELAISMAANCSLGLLAWKFNNIQCCR